MLELLKDNLITVEALEEREYNEELGDIIFYNQLVLFQDVKLEAIAGDLEYSGIDTEAVAYNLRAMFGSSIYYDKQTEMYYFTETI